MLMFCFVFFFKQKTAYELRISDCSSDVCSSDLLGGRADAYYLHYFGSAAPAEWRLALPVKKGEPLHRYRVDIIDTWNMTVTPVEGQFAMARLDDYDVHDPARPTIALPGKPWIAVRVRRV